MKKQLSIILLMAVSLCYGQNRDTVWLKSGEVMATEVLSPIFGKTPDKKFFYRRNGRIASTVLSEVKEIHRGPIVSKPITFKVGKEEYSTIANQYYFGEYNLYEAKVKDFGRINLIEKNGISTLLTTDNLEATLITVLGSCSSSSGIPSSLNKKVGSRELIDIANKYHDCAKKPGTSAVFKDIGFLSFNAIIEFSQALTTGVSASSKLPFNQTIDAFGTNYGIETSEWEALNNQFYSIGFTAYFSQLGLELGPILRYNNQTLSTNYYNVGPYRNDEVYSEFDLELQNLDLGLMITIGNPERDFMPFFRLSVFENISMNLNLQETKFESQTEQNLPLSVSVSQGSGAQVSFAIGTNWRNFQLLAGLTRSTYLLEINGPTFEIAPGVGRTSVGLDKGQLGLSQAFLSLSYRLPLKRKVINMRY